MENNSSNHSNRSDCEEWWCGETTTLLTMEIIVILLTVVGSFGNLITTLAILFSSLRSNVNCILIGSLSFAGFLYCSIILSFQAVILHQQTTTISDGFCSAAAAIRYTLVGVIMVHLGVIALYRYFNIVHLEIYFKASQTRPLVITIAICWILPMVFTIPPAFKLWGAYTFQPAVLACTFTSQNSIENSNRILMVTLGFIVPCILIIFCYARIGCVAYGSSKRISKWKGNAAQLSALRLSTMMLCIFFIFFVGTCPYFIVSVSDRYYTRPMHHIWTTMLGWLLYCLNPIVYTVMDTNFRTAYRRFLVGDCEKNPLRRQHTIVGSAV